MSNRAEQHVKFLLGADKETVHQWCDNANDDQLLAVLQALYRYTLQLSVTIEHTIEKRLQTDQWTESNEVMRRLIDNTRPPTL